MDDFVTNGILLPAIPSVSKVIGLPLHIGGHPNYNSRIIAELHMIRVSCESVWGDSQRQKKAVQGVRGVQDRARHSINSQGADHIDWVVLPAPADASLDCLIDRLFARLTPKMAIFGA